MDLVGRFCFVDINFGGDCFGVSFVGQCLLWYVDEVRIVEIFGMVGIGMFFCFCYYLYGVGVVKIIFLYIEVFEDIEDLYDMDFVGGWWWYRVNFIFVIFVVNWCMFYSFIVGEIGFGDQFVVFFYFVSDLVGDGFFIEGVWVVFGNQFQVFIEVFLYQLIVFFQWFVVFLEDCFIIFMLWDYFVVVGFQIVCQCIVNDKFFFCQFNCWMDYFV